MILTPELLATVQRRLGDLRGNVKLIAFNSETLGAHGGHVQALAAEIANLHPALAYENYSIEKNPEKAKAYGVDKAPALIVENNEGKQARFFGLPAGEEFSVFISNLVDLSRGNPSLPQEIIHKAREIAIPTHLQVFVTANCPYCPGMARLAQGLAMVNPHIRADIIRIEEFRALADRYNVMGVPKTIINDRAAIEGAVPSDLFMKKLKEMQG